MGLLNTIDLLGGFTADVNISRVRDPVYYLHDFWNDISDKGINQKPFMSGGPWGWIAVIGLLIYFIRVWGPRFMRDRDAIDMRPYMLVINGLTFGGYITGFCTGLWYANWGLYAFSCTALDPSDQSITMWIRKSVGYVFFGGKVWDFARPLIAVFRKRDHEITNLYLFHCFSSVFFVFLGLKLYPGGVFIFLPYLDGVYQIFAQAYLIMAATYGTEMKPSYAYRLFLYRLKMVSGIMVLLHGAYFSMVPNCGPAFLKYFQVIYAFAGLIIGPSEWRKMEKARQQTPILREQDRQRRAIQQKIE